MKRRTVKSIVFFGICYLITIVFTFYSYPYEKSPIEYLWVDIVIFSFIYLIPIFCILFRPDNLDFHKLSTKRDIEKNTLLISYGDIQYIIDLKKDLPYHFPTCDYSGKKVSFFTRARLQNLFELGRYALDLKDGFTFLFPHEIKDTFQVSRYDDPNNYVSDNSSFSPALLVVIFLVILFLFYFHYTLSNIKNLFASGHILTLFVVVLFIIFLFYLLRKSSLKQEVVYNQLYICKMYIYSKRMYSSSEHSSYYVRVYDKEKYILWPEIMVSREVWENHCENDEVILDINIRSDTNVFIDIDPDKNKTL